MAHELEKASDMAYVGTTPCWHGLRNMLPKNQPIEIWQKSAGMDFQIMQTDVLFNAQNNDGNLLNLRSNKDASVLYRSDTNEALSIVSKRYKTVQPKTMLEIYLDLVSDGGFELETAGVLKGGKKLWALARTGQETLLPGLDKVKAYLLLATSCDGSLRNLRRRAPGCSSVISNMAKWSLAVSCNQMSHSRIKCQPSAQAGRRKSAAPLSFTLNFRFCKIDNLVCVGGCTFEWQLVWLGWWYRLSYVTVKKSGWRGQWQHLLSLPRDKLRKNPPTHTASVDEESSGFDRRFDRKLTQVCPPQHF